MINDAGKHAVKRLPPSAVRKGAGHDSFATIEDVPYFRETHPHFERYRLETEN
jgi:hypothetical protein